MKRRCSCDGRRCWRRRRRWRWRRRRWWRRRVEIAAAAIRWRICRFHTIANIFDGVAQMNVGLLAKVWTNSRRLQINIVAKRKALQSPSRLLTVTCSHEPPRFLTQSLSWQRKRVIDLSTNLKTFDSCKRRFFIVKFSFHEPKTLFEDRQRIVASISVRV